MQALELMAQEQQRCYLLELKCDQLVLVGQIGYLNLPFQLIDLNQKLRLRLDQLFLAILLHEDSTPQIHYLLVVDSTIL